MCVFGDASFHSSVQSIVFHPHPSFSDFHRFFLLLSACCFCIEALFATSFLSIRRQHAVQIKFYRLVVISWIWSCCINMSSRSGSMYLLEECFVVYSWCQQSRKSILCFRIWMSIIKTMNFNSIQNIFDANAGLFYDANKVSCMPGTIMPIHHNYYMICANFWF